MAFCVFSDGSTTTVPADKAVVIWEVLTGSREPDNDAQVAFCDKVKRLYLNRETAPASYLEKHPTGYDVPESFARTLGKRR